MAGQDGGCFLEAIHYPLHPLVRFEAHLEGGAEVGGAEEEGGDLVD